jgi:hypothetical protein
VVTFRQRDLALLCYATRDLLTRRKLWGHPIPPGMDALERRLQAMSADGHELSSGAAELRQNTLIGAAQAATLLGCTARHVRRIAADLEGQRVEGQWVFRASVVAAYAAAKAEGRQSDSA